MRKQIFSATRMRWSPIPTQPNGATASQFPAGINTFTLRSKDKAGNVSEKLVLSVTGTSGTLEAPTINCPGISEPTSDCSITSNSTTITLTGDIPEEPLSKAKMPQILENSFRSQVPPPATIPRLEAGAIHSQSAMALIGSHSFHKRTVKLAHRRR